MCILALVADIGGFDERSMGHSDCLSVYYLRLGATDHFREREHERVSWGACRKTILHFDLEFNRAVL